MDRRAMTIMGVFAGLFAFSASAADLLFVTLDSPPMEFASNGEPKGFNVEVAQEAMKRLGHSARVQLVPWQRALDMVQDGSADAIIDAGFNAERARFLNYPDENIYTEEVCAFKLKGNPVELRDDLSNAPVISLGVGRGFLYGGKIQEKIDGKAFQSIEDAVDLAANVKKLLGKRYDILIGVKQNALFTMKQLGVADQIVLVSSPTTGKPMVLSSSRTFLAFSKAKRTQEIARQVGPVLRAMKEDGTYQRIYAKYE